MQLLLLSFLVFMLQIVLRKRVSQGHQGRVKDDDYNRLPPDRFYRIHDRHTINCRYLFSVSSCDRKCKLKNPLTKVTLSLKISERRYKDFTRFINDFMFPE